MKEPDSMVANRTRQLSNHRCESFEDNVPGLERGGRTGGLASGRAIALSELCSAVTTATRIRFEWNIERGEPLSNGRNQHLWARRVYAPEEHSGVREIARSQGLVYKAGKDPGHRRTMRECVVPTSFIAQGLADQVVVPMTSLITREKRKGPVDMVVFGIADGQAIALRARSRYLSGPSHWKSIVPGPLYRRRNVHQTEREGCM